MPGETEVGLDRAVEFGSVEDALLVENEKALEISVGGSRLEDTRMSANLPLEVETKRGPAIQECSVEIEQDSGELHGRPALRVKQAAR